MRQYLGLTLLSALDDSVDIDRCPATLRNVDATACGGCCRRCLQGTFKEDFTDGHSSEVIEAMFYPRHLLEKPIKTPVASTYRYWVLERHDGGVVLMS